MGEANFYYFTCLKNPDFFEEEMAFKPFKGEMAWPSTSEWNGSEVDNYLQMDEALIISTVSEALGQITRQLQFVWTMKKCAGAIVIKVQEEEEEGQGEAFAGADEMIDGDYPSDEEDDDDGTGVCKYKGLTASSNGTDVRLSPAPIGEWLEAAASIDLGTKECHLVARAVTALEHDLSNNFAKELLKKTFQKNNGTKYLSIVIAALYLLPRGVSSEEVRKFAMECIFTDKDRRRIPDFIKHNLKSAMEKLVKMKVFTTQSTDDEAPKHFLSGDILAFLNKLGFGKSHRHNGSKLARFKARYTKDRMDPRKVKNAKQKARMLRENALYKKYKKSDLQQTRTAQSKTVPMNKAQTRPKKTDLMLKKEQIKADFDDDVISLE